MHPSRAEADRVHRAAVRRARIGSFLGGVIALLPACVVLLLGAEDPASWTWTVVPAVHALWLAGVAAAGAILAAAVTRMTKTGATLRAGARLREVWAGHDAIQDRLGELRLYQPWGRSVTDALGHAHEHELAVLRRALGADETAAPNDVLRTLRRAGSHEAARAVRWARGQEADVDYNEVVRDAGAILGVRSPVPTEQECLLAFGDAATVMSGDETAAVLSRAEASAPSFKKSFFKEALSAAAMGGGQASGFGVYLAASTLMGAASKAVGVTLAFPFYTLMSTSIAAVIGVPGATALLLHTANKLGAPAYKKTVPAVLVIAAIRARLEYDRLVEMEALERKLIEFSGREAGLLELLNGT